MQHGPHQPIEILERCNVATSLSPSRARGGARSLARFHVRAVAARAVMAAAAATDDARGDGRSNDPLPAPPSGTGACQLCPPPQKHHRVAPSSSRFCPFSRPLSRRARWRDSGTPTRPSVRMAAPCARVATEPPNPNPNNARMARMTRDPARTTSPNLPSHALERARPPPRPPPRPSPRPPPRRPTGRHQRHGRDRESERATGCVRRASAGWPTGADAPVFKWPLRSPPHGKPGRAARACVR